MTLFFETDDGPISHQFTRFYIGSVAYIMDFSSDEAVISGIMALDDEITLILTDRNVCTVKFAVEEYYESNDDIDLYAPPKNHQFGKAEIRSLKNHLEQLLLEHYRQYRPECYFFIAERPSLTRMYQKMCDNKSINMVEFHPISRLGENQDCFIVKTPSWRT